MLFNIILLIIILYVAYNYMNKKMNSHKNDTIKTLMRQSARWVMASNQDRNPIIALQHANLGVGYLSALRDIATDEEIEAVSGVNVQKFKSEIIKEQSAITKHVIKLCPKTGPTVQLANNKEEL